MPRDMIDASDLVALSVDLNKIPARMVPAAHDAIGDGAHAIRDAWRDNAEETSGKHARHYPRTITAKPKVSRHIEFEVAPDPRINRQAYLSEILEYGGTYSPPHLDATRAATEQEPKLEKAVGQALDNLLRGL